MAFPEHTDSIHLKAWMDAIWKADSSDLDISGGEADDLDSSFGPLDKDSSSSSEDETETQKTQIFKETQQPAVQYPPNQLFSESTNTPQNSKNLKRKVESKQNIYIPTEPLIEISPTTSSTFTNTIQSSTTDDYWISISPGEFHPILPAPLHIENYKSENLAPQDYFHKYIPIEMIKTLTDFTNLRYLQNTGKNLRLTEHETKQFIAISIMMSYLKYPRIRMYWSRETRVPAIADNMTRDRYFTIKNNLKLRDDLTVKDEEKAEDKFWKIRPLIQTVIAGCLKNEKSSNVAIGEQIIPFYDHVPGRQYFKGRHPCGLKIFLATAPDGLPLDFFIYKGSADAVNSHNDSYINDLDTGGKVVLKLCENLPPGCTLYMDRYFTSVHLLDILRFKAQCQGTGILKKCNIPPNVNFKSDYEMKRLGRGSVDEKIRYDGQTCVLKWYDNKPVILASSVYGKCPEDKCKRWSKKDKEYVHIKRPIVVKKYNTFMKGVDFLDRVIGYYRINARTKKWTIRVIMHLLDFAIAASWIEYKRHQTLLKTRKKDIMDYLAFRVKLQNYMFYGPEKKTSENDGTPEKRRRVSHISLPSSQDVLHLPEIQKPARKNRCRMPGCKSNTARVMCTSCKVYLCLQEDRPCFKRFHEI